MNTDETLLSDTTTPRSRADIVLAAFNARYHHASLALRYLMAGLGNLEDRAVMIEATINDRPVDAAERILALEPKICGLSVHVWSADATEATLGIIKTVRPDLIVILGGPEVSFPEELPAWTAAADHIIVGDGERALADLCRAVLTGDRRAPRIIQTEPSDPNEIVLPYRLYTEADIRHRTLYVETSRGCPHGCEFCLASLDEKVRRFSTGAIREALDELWRRGARSFKFVDRSLDARTAEAVLGFFGPLALHRPFVHLELVPDRMPANLIDLLAPFEPGCVQLEAGVQTFSPEIAARIGRRQDPDAVEANLRTLLRSTGAHIHADLVAGLPGEDLESLAAGFDRLAAIGVHEIQVGILKRLRGAPIARHDREWDMRYNPRPPYEILSTGAVPYPEMQRLKRFARYFDMVCNSGAFTSLATPILGDSPFEAFTQLSDWLFRETGRTAAISQHRLASLLFGYLTEERGLDAEEIATAIVEDFTRRGQRRIPGEIRDASRPIAQEPPHIGSGGSLPARQRNRHR